MPIVTRIYMHDTPLLSITICTGTLYLVIPQDPRLEEAVHETLAGRVRGNNKAEVADGMFGGLGVPGTEGFPLGGCCLSPRRPRRRFYICRHFRRRRPLPRRGPLRRRQH